MTVRIRTGRVMIAQGTPKIYQGHPTTELMPDGQTGIGYVKNNALKGRVFGSLAEQNRFLAQWEEQVATAPPPTDPHEQLPRLSPAFRSVQPRRPVTPYAR